MPVYRREFCSFERYGTGPLEDFRRFTNEHHTTYQLRGNDDRWIMDIAPEHVQEVTVKCATTGMGYVGVTHIPLNSIPSVMAAFMASLK